MDDLSGRAGESPFKLCLSQAIRCTARHIYFLLRLKWADSAPTVITVNTNTPSGRCEAGVVMTSLGFFDRANRGQIQTEPAAPRITLPNCVKLSKVNAGEVAERLKAAVC